MEVLDNAAKLCAKFWDNKVYRGYPKSCETVVSNKPVIPSVKAAHHLFKEFSNASNKKLNESSEFIELQSMYTFFVKHANRKAYQLEYVRFNSTCCTHCLSLPNVKINF